MDKKVRIEWVDIFKALTILSVVIGHSTGKYNMFIYQFHMAAFFFISGYTVNLGQRSFLNTIWSKFCSMLLPLLSIFMLGLGCIKILDFLGVYNILFQDDFVGIVIAIKEFFFFGNNYILWMGATWFLIVLFGGTIVHKAIYDLFGRTIGWKNFLFSLVILMIAYKYINIDINMSISIFPIDLIMIGQFYIGLGIFFKKFSVLEMILVKKYMLPIILLITSYILYYFGIIAKVTVDYPSRSFGFLLTDIIAALNGTVWIYILSKLATYLPNRIKKILIYIGKNTIGILFFHFMFFNITFALLYLLGVVPFSYLKNFIPTKEIGDCYWWLFTIISIYFSILLWKIIIKNNIIRGLLGEDKKRYEDIYDTFSNTRFCKKIKEVKFLSYKINIISNIQEIKSKIIANKISIVILSLISILTLSPMLATGIMCNDELQHRFQRMHGFVNLVKSGFQNEIRMGRPMRSLASIQQALGFTSSYLYAFKGIQMILILINIILFYFLINVLFENRKFAVFTSVLTLIFLPVTFEHTLPNAFVGLVSMPMTFLFISLILYAKYSRTKRTNLLIISMILFFTSMMGYEFIVTFVLLYPIIYYGKTHKSSVFSKKFIMKNITPFIVALVYLILMFGLQRLTGSAYEGALMGFESIGSSAKIIWTLFKSSIPGYYLFNAKYKFLFRLYSNIPISLGKSAVSDSLFYQSESFIGSTLDFIFENVLTLRVIILLGLLVISCIYLLNTKKERSFIKPLPSLIILVGITYMWIPSVPNSLSKLYQGNVDENNFTGLPVSYFLYFAAVFTIACLLWKLLENRKLKLRKILCISLICIYCIPIQSMNEVFSKEQNLNYKRIVKIESLFETQTIKQMNNQMIYAPDFYKQQNTLAIQDHYWDQFAKMKGLNIVINKGEMAQGEMFEVFFQNDEYFVVIGGNEVVVLSTKRLIGELPIRISSSEYSVGEFKSPVLDSMFYRYSFKIEKRDDKNFLIPYSGDPFETIKIQVGSNLQTANKIRGFFDDGWCGNNVEFKIHTSDQGILIIDGYYNKVITGNEKIAVFINDEKFNDFTLVENAFIINVNTVKNKDILVRLESSFEFQADKPDVRFLSYIIKNIECK